MGIMIPVYIINALYIYPITLWVYLQHGRPPKPGAERDTPSQNQHNSGSRNISQRAQNSSEEENIQTGLYDHGDSDPQQESSRPPLHFQSGGIHDHALEWREDGDTGQKHNHNMLHERGSSRPTFTTVTIGVCHCGAGCMLGDIVGEWLVYGTGVTIDDKALWPAYLIDFAFAIGFGIIFQYFSIAPMAGEYGAKTLWRAVKADIWSLLFFQIGLFGWMAIYQIAIWHWKLEETMVTYWWMMQIGMFWGHWTSVPVNYWLIMKGIKEPCV